MKWNEYTNTCSDTPDFEERLDVSKMELTEVSLITDGKIVWTTKIIRKVYPQ